MFGYGDDPNPAADSVDLLEDIVVEYITDMVRGAQLSSSSSPCPPDLSFVFYVVVDQEGCQGGAQAGKVQTWNGGHGVLCAQGAQEACPR